MKRRDLIKQLAWGSAAGWLHSHTGLIGHAAEHLLVPSEPGASLTQDDEPEPGERPEQDSTVRVVNPSNKVPLSFIIDDSTCLVNLAHFCIPQFASVFPDRYRQDWRKLPREIPDDFVRKFADWCGEREIKGKYSIVPYPACVGWVDRELPGWTHQQLQQSIQLVNDRLAPGWDIHPEMISHTWAIDIRTGRPYPQRTQDFMENWGFSVGLTPDQMTDYLAYALRILKNAGFTCDGVTTPGGFGNRSRKSLSIGALRACREVFQAEIPHYFRHLYTDDRSVAPRVENARRIDSDQAECVVSIIGCTGDWFGGWDGLTPGESDKFITADLQSGRMVEVIQRQEPAIMVCHWPGIYYNGEELGFQIFQTVVQRVHERFRDQVVWMKLSEISRYWAARELTRITRRGNEIEFYAPFACPGFTLAIDDGSPAIHEAAPDRRQVFRAVKLASLAAGTFARDGRRSIACFDLPQGSSKIRLA